MQTFVNVAPVITPGKWGKIGLEDLAQEPSLFSASTEMVKMSGGPLAKQALAQIEELYEMPIRHAKEKGLSAIVDVRVQRLMPGMFPSIPGWHCDAVPRCNYHGQPNFSLIVPEAFHVALLLSNEPKGVSNTEYVNGILKARIWDEQHVYKDLHVQVERIKPHTIHAVDGAFVWFTPKTIHRAEPTVRRGWRMFFRYSMYHHPPIKNAIQNVQQVYILSEANGW